MEARAELQIVLMVKELRTSKKLSQVDLAKKWVNLNQLLDELKMDQLSRLFPCQSKSLQQPIRNQKSRLYNELEVKDSKKSKGKLFDFLFDKSVRDLKR